MALSLMRIGCIQHGCCYGRPTDVPWALTFLDPHSSVRRSWRGLPLHPTQVYEAVGALAIFLFVHFVVFARVRDGRLRVGASFCASTALYAALRFGLDFYRGADLGIFRPFGLTSAQVIAVLSFAFALAMYRSLALSKETA